MYRKLYYLFLTVALLCGVACSSDGGDEGETPGTGGSTGGSVTEINGTKILEGNDLVGLITDAASGKGIAGIPVSDGYSFTTTDANGVYQFKANRYCRNVFYTTPSTYKVALDPASKLPLFYSTSTIIRGQQNRNDFKLEPLAVAEDDFTLIAIGDPQCKSDSDVNRWKNETIPDIKSTLMGAQAQNKWTNAYAVTLGDITFDNTVQWDPMKKSMSNMQVGAGYLPVFNCMGNHDHDAKQANTYTAQTNFIERFGPVDYSFNRGKAHIVVMDNVVCTSTNGSTWTYDAGYSQQQFNWLKADLDLVENKADKLVFLCCHIPFRSGSNSGGSNVNKDKYYAEVLQLLAQFHEAHIMIGHTHYPENYVHTNYVCKNGKPIYEHVHGAACGGWWASNLNVDGAPQGYSIYEIKGNTVDTWVAKPTAQSENYQMRVYNGDDTYTGSKNYSYTWTGGGTGGSSKIKTNGNTAMANCFIAEIWNDDSTYWKVDFVQNGQATPMKRITSLADMCVTSFFFNECGKNTTSWNKACKHTWYIKAPSGNPAAEQNWTIRATQTIPGSGKTNVYEASGFHSGYAGFKN